MNNQSIDTKLKQLIASAYKLGRIAQEDNLSETAMADELRVLQSQGELILASRPTCGKEQRKLLNQLEYMDMEAIVVRVFAGCNIDIDKVINGE